MPKIVLTVCTLSALFFLTASGTLYSLMALKLRRKGRPIKFLSLSFDPRVRFGIVKEVFRNYRQLKQEENKPPLLPFLFWTSMALSLLSIVATFIALALP